MTTDPTAVPPSSSITSAPSRCVRRTSPGCSSPATAPSRSRSRSACPTSTTRRPRAAGDVPRGGGPQPAARPGGLPRRPRTGPETRTARSPSPMAAHRDAVEHAVEMRRFDEARHVGRPAARRDAPVPRRSSGSRGAWRTSTPRREPTRPWTEPSGSSARSTTRSPRSPASWTARAPRTWPRGADGRRLLVTPRWQELDGRGARRPASATATATCGSSTSILDEHGLASCDCVEFDPGLRRIDVAARSRLPRHGPAPGRPPGARRRAAGRLPGGRRDPGSGALLGLLAAYRAQVRAKVALTRAAQHGPGAGRALSRCSALAVRLLWQALTPLDVVIAGVAASGKSTLAASARRRDPASPTRAPTSSARRSPGLPATARAPRTLYAPERSGDVRGAGPHGRGGREHGVIVDGTFRSRDDRAAFFAQLTSTPLVHRVRRARPRCCWRARRPASARRTISDADVSVVAGQLGHFEPLDELPAANHAILRSDRPPAELVSEAGYLVAQRATTSRPRRPAAR